MTWVKLSDSFADECEELSSDAYRLHVDGLCFSMQKETGGHITPVQLRKATGAKNPKRAVKELVEKGFWRDTESGWAIDHHMQHQPSVDEIAARRANDALRQRNWRRYKQGLPPVDINGNVCDESQDMSRRD